MEVRQRVEVSSRYTSPKLTASVNEIVLGIDENTPMDLLANFVGRTGYLPFTEFLDRKPWLWGLLFGLGTDSFKEKF